MAAYVLSEAVAVALWITLQSMAAQGNDLQQSGLTQYMFDIVYVTWFVQLASLLWGKLWYLYLIVRARTSLSFCRFYSHFVRRFPGMQRSCCTKRCCSRTCSAGRVRLRRSSVSSRAAPRPFPPNNRKHRKPRASGSRNSRHAPQKATPASRCATADPRARRYIYVSRARPSVCARLAPVLHHGELCACRAPSVVLTAYRNCSCCSWWLWAHMPRSCARS